MILDKHVLILATKKTDSGLEVELDTNFRSLAKKIGLSETKAYKQRLKYPFNLDGWFIAKVNTAEHIEYLYKKIHKLK